MAEMNRGQSRKSSIQPGSERTLPYLSIGFGLHQAWVYATMFGAPMLFGTQMIWQGSFGTHLTLPYVVSIFAYVVCLLFAGATDQKFLNFYTSKKLLVVSAVLACIGTFLFLFTDSISNQFLGVISGLTTGAGSAFLIIFWGVAYSRCDAKVIVAGTAISVFLSIVVFVLLLSFIPYPVSEIIAMLIPLVELWLLWQITPEEIPEGDDADNAPIFNPLPVNRLRFLLTISVPIVIMGIVLSSLRQISIQAMLPAASPSNRLLLVVASGITMLIFFLAMQKNDGTIRWERYFRPAIPFVALAFIPGFFNASGSSFVLALIPLIGCFSFEALLWIFFCGVSANFRVSPVLMFGLGRGMMAFGILVETFLPAIVSTYGNISLDVYQMSLMFIILLLIGCALLPRERDIARLVKSGPMLANSFRSDLDAEQLAPGAQGSSAPGVQAPSYDANANGVNTANGLNGADNTTRVTHANDANVGSVANGSAEASGQTHGAESSSGQTQPVSKPAPHQSPKLSYRSSVRLAGMSIGYEGPENTGKNGAKDQKGGKRPGPFRIRCEAVANTFLLSRRETEVFFYLAKGFNAKYIENKLFISEGTAKTHIRHIYRKLNVHSQQELMRLVDNAEVTKR